MLLRWALQHEVVVIPKSGKPARITENAGLFDFTLDERDMAALDALERRLPHLLGSDARSLAAPHLASAFRVHRRAAR